MPGPVTAEWPQETLVGRGIICVWFIAAFVLVLRLVMTGNIALAGVVLAVMGLASAWYTPKPRRPEGTDT